jgi:hypothetical protein
VKLACALALSLTLACSGSSGNAPGADAVFPAAALETALSSTGSLMIEVRTSPDQPPSHGVLTVEFFVKNAGDSAPVDGLVMSAEPWMPSHGHGASVRPTVTPRGNGRYVLTNVDLYMPGSWQLRTAIAGPLSDRVDVPLDVL